MITLSAISMILPPSKMPFLIDVCLPVFSAVTLYCVLYILYVLPLYYVVLCFRYFHRPSLFYQNFSMLLCKTCAFIKDYLTWLDLTFESVVNSRAAGFNHERETKQWWCCGSRLRRQTVCRLRREPQHYHFNCSLVETQRNADVAKD